jgi:glycosyltransferase involved in cell wall biosynthesis
MSDNILVPTVSVIIPVYNRSTLIARAVNSVLAQDFKDYEIIVIDDGSTDETPKILSTYKDKIKIITQKNRGVSAARNTGVSISLGKYLAFLDSDDMWLPEKLSTQINYFKSNPNTLICQTEEIWIRNGIRVNPKKKHKKQSGMIFISSLHLCLVSPSAVMLKKELFNIFEGFDESLPACEDYDLWLRISCRYPIKLVNKSCVIKYGGHDDQLSKMPGLDKFRILAICKSIESGYLSHKQTDAAISVLKKKCLVYANGCKKRERFIEAQKYMQIYEKYK